MYAKSMIEYARARAVAGAWSRHLRFVPVALALAVAALPFTLEPQFVKSAGSASVAPGASAAAPGELHAGDNPIKTLVPANMVTSPKRVVMPLDAQQRAVSSHITRKFGVSGEVVQELVRTAFAAGKQFGVDPLLVVAIMAVESSFNPIAESYAGAKGLMQIIPKFHLEKFADFGGEHAVFDPRVNILVGARIVREYLLMASGDLFTALQTYAGALGDRSAAYTHRVLNEKDQLDALAGNPKTDRGNRVTMQVEAPRPGTIVVPKIEAPAPVPGVAAPAPAAIVPPPALAVPLAVPKAAPAAVKPAEEAKAAPAVPAPQASVSGVTLTQGLPESVLRF
jgi:soluble lytic murein transglycosylase-like protein